jgi:hypothetical protein
VLGLIKSAALECAPRGIRINAVVLALLSVALLSACGRPDEDGDRAASAPDATTSAPSSNPTPASGEQDAGASDSMQIQISFGDTFASRLLDNPTARDLAAQLPLTLTFRDHNNVEKTAPLPRPLNIDGAPTGHDPAAGDIGYWAPDGDFVLYHDNDAPYFEGIVRIGRFNGDIEAIRRLPETARVTIARAG